LPDCSPRRRYAPGERSACCALTCVNQTQTNTALPTRLLLVSVISVNEASEAIAAVPSASPPQTPAVPLRTLVAHNLHRLREEAGVALDDVVRASWGDGFDWTTAWLGAVERGTRSLTAEQLLALPVVLSAGLGRRITLADLLAGEAPVSLGVDGRASVPARYLRDVVTGEPVREPFATPVVVAPPPGIDVAARAAEKLREIRRGGLADVDIRALTRAEAGAGEAESRLARRLGVAPIRVIAAAASLWGHSLTEERDARLADGAGPAAVVARRLSAELTERIEEAARRAPPD
jgi:hypothetical protein